MALTAAERDSGGGRGREGGLMGMRTVEEGDERWDEREGKNKMMRGMQREMEEEERDMVGKRDRVGKDERKRGVTEKQWQEKRDWGH